LGAALWTLVVLAICTSIGKSIAEHNQPKAESWFGVWWRGAIWSIAMAAFAFVTTGQPSCEEYSDPVNGSCISYADDGYQWTASRASERAFDVLWKTIAAGTVGLFLFKRDLDKKAGGRYRFPSTKYLSSQLATDLDAFVKCLEILSANIVCGHNKSNSEFYKDYASLDRAMKKALEIVSANPDQVKRSEFLAAFNAARDVVVGYASADSGLGDTVFGKRVSS
jgi:hypothetical protein